MIYYTTLLNGREVFSSSPGAARPLPSDGGAVVPRPGVDIQILSLSLSIYIYI